MTSMGDLISQASSQREYSNLLESDKFGIISVKSYGAVGDGVTDDTDAIQNALDAVNNIGGGIVEFPYGTYIVSAALTLYDNATLRGFNATIQLYAESNTSVISATDKNDITISGLVIDANCDNQTSAVFAVYLDGGTGNVVRECEVKNADYGIGVDSATNFLVQNNNVHDITYYGICVFSSSAESTNFKIVGNTVYNCKDTDVPSASADGSGIILSGLPNATPKSYVKYGVIDGNICYDNGKNGVSVICGENINISNNICYGHDINNDIGAGINVSAASQYVNITSNNCYDNYDAGIQLDVATETPGESIDFGYCNVIGNICKDNTISAIKNNNVPKVNIVGNSIEGSDWGIFFNQNGQLSTVSDNKIENCNENGIRVVGNSGPASGAQTDLNISRNRLYDCSTTSGSTNAAIYLKLWSNVIVSENIFTDNTKDLVVASDCDNIDLINNNINGTIILHANASINSWRDTRRGALTSFLSSDYAGELKNYITLADAFTVGTFGRDFVALNAVSNRVSSLTTAIANGFEGQLITLINLNTSTITIKHGANTENIGDADIVLSRGEMVTFLYKASAGWLQTTAKLATSL